MKISLILILYVMFPFWGCTVGQKLQESPMRALKCQLNIIMQNENYDTTEMTSYFLVYKFKEFNVFQLPVELSRTEIFVDSNHDIVGDSLYSIGTAYRYIVTKKGINDGEYYLQPDSLPRIVAADSFSKKQTVYNMNTWFSKFLQESRLVSSHWDTDRKFLFEAYQTTDKKDSTYGDSTYLYYRKDLADYEMSMSTYMDSLKNIKLSKVRFIYNNWPKEKFRGRLQTKEVLVSAEPVPVENKNEIMDLVNKFESHLHR